MRAVGSQYGPWASEGHRSKINSYRVILIESQCVNDVVKIHGCCPKDGKACWRTGVTLGSGLETRDPEGDSE